MRILYLTANPQWVRLRKAEKKKRQASLAEQPLTVTAAPARVAGDEKKSRIAKMRKNFKKYKKLELIT